MNRVDVITVGDEQSVRLPANCRIDATQVLVKRVGRSVLLIPQDVDPWDVFADSLPQFTEDFVRERRQGDTPDAR